MYLSVCVCKAAAVRVSSEVERVVQTAPSSRTRDDDNDNNDNNNDNAGFRQLGQSSSSASTAAQQQLQQLQQQQRQQGQQRQLEGKLKALMSSGSRD